MRAKDKEFNAEMQTDFDIGRVLLNLFNNAFYTVNEQKSSDSISYQPTVSVPTQKCDDKIQITGRDNGNDHFLPQNLQDKGLQ